MERDAYAYPQARASAVRQAFALLTETLRARVELGAAGPSGSMVDGLEATLAVVPDPDVA